MKRFTSMLLVAIFAGAITLGAYVLFIENSVLNIISQNEDGPFITTNYTPTSAKGAGINEVDFTIAAQKTVDAVVHVKNMTTSTRASSISEFFYGSQSEQLPQIGTGSGVIITPDGYIVTNNHVVANASKIGITLNNNKNYDAEVIGTDANSDIALLKIDAEENLPYLAFGDSDDTKIGEWVLAVGNPFSLTSTVTAGIISAKARNLGRTQSFIQSDAAVNPGNSGGALVNTNGDLIGINTAITSQTGTYVGYSFAVPSNIARKVVEDIMEYGNVQKGILGIQTISVNSRQAVEEGINEIDGVYISSIEEESGADEANLESGDIITKVDHVRVRKFGDLIGYISAKRPGNKVEVTLERNGKELVVPVTLKESQTLIVPNIGMVVKNLSAKDKRSFNTKEGVKIMAVPERYAGYGLEGKLIVAVDDEPVTNIKDAKRLFEQISRKDRTSITMLDENGERERLIFE